MDEKITVDECIDVAAKSPLVRAATVASKEFDDALRFAWNDRDNEWLKTSIAGHLARTFMGMLQVAQDTGVSVKQIAEAIKAEMHQHAKAAVNVRNSTDSTEVVISTHQSNETV